MENNDICFFFQNAKDKREQIYILAQLTNSDTDTIIEVLKDHKLCVKYAKCRKCSKLFPKYLDPYCEQCRVMVERAKRHEVEKQKYVLKRITENEILRKDYLLKASELQIENTKLVEWLV